MPPAWTRRLEEERLAEQVRYCYERAPFYRRKLDDAGVRPEGFGLQNLGDIPFTTKEELRDSQAETPPYGDFVCADAIEISRAHLSSGPTGQPIVMAYTGRDLDTS